MRKNYIALCWVLIVACVSSVAQQPAEITKANADEHLVKRIEPDYPPLAKAARIQGKVLLKATISGDGGLAQLRWRHLY
jgi:outer membrane biosynthesis protein TonB